MCGAALAQPYGGYTVPPPCLQLMKNSEEVDLGTVTGKVKIHLCKECTEIGRKMAMEYDTSPLPECDCAAAEWGAVDTMNLLAGGDLSDTDGLTDRMATSALSTVKADLDGGGRGVIDSKLTEARVIVLSLSQLGILELDMF
jgi:hypothetical protein